MISRERQPIRTQRTSQYAKFQYQQIMTQVGSVHLATDHEAQTPFFYVLKLSKTNLGLENFLQQSPF